MKFVNKHINNINIILPILVFLLLLEGYFFLKDSLTLVSNNNKSNFAYTIKARDASEELDKIVERAEVNVDVAVDIIERTYDINKIRTLSYDYNYLKSIDVLIKSILINSPGADGAWFMYDVNSPYFDYYYLWYSYKDGKLIDVRNQLNAVQSDARSYTDDTDPYYFQAVNSRSAIWSKIYTDYDTKQSMMTIAKSIYVNNKLVGVIGIDITSKTLANKLKEVQKIFDGADIFLVDDNYEIVLSQIDMGKGKRALSYKFLDKLKQVQGDDKLIEFYDEGMHKTAVMLRLSNDYSIVVTFNNNIIYNGFNRLMATTYLIFGILILMSIIALLNRNKIIKMNKKLANEMLKLRVIIDESPNAIMIKDLNGRYVDCNKMFYESMGYSNKEDIIGKTAFELFDNEAATQILADNEWVIKNKKVLISELFQKVKGGKKVFLRRYIVPLFDYNKELVGVMINAFDISNVKKEQEYLQNAKESAEKASQMKSSFLANMSHEIRTPMNGVLGFIQLLKETNMDSEQAEFLDNAQKSSEILLNLINDILDFSKIEAGKFQLEKIGFNLTSVIEDVLIMNSTAAESKNLELGSLISSDIPECLLGDPGRFKQALNNLVNNAVKFTDSGEILISAKMIDKKNNKSYVAIEVKDSGIGIEKNKLKEIFNDFVQADDSTTRKYGGTGLGLSIAKKLIELMDGKISVTSKLNQGSIFTLLIPFENTDEKPNLLPKTIDKMINASIVVFDTHLTTYEVINYYLQDLGCFVVHMDDENKLFEYLNTNKCDAILICSASKKTFENTLSLNLKQNDTTKNIPLVFCSTLAKRGDAKLAKDNGFSAYLSKPIRKNDLIGVISNVIEKNNNNEFDEFVTKHSIKEAKFLNKPKILVVEDSEINCKLICKIVNKNNMNCDIAINGAEAINAYKSKKYDLILMDCQMPVLNGYETTAAIRELESDTSEHVPIIAMTANALSQDKNKCLESGMDEYITKPIDIDILISTMSKYINNIQREKTQMAHQKIQTDDIDGIISQMITDLEFEKREVVELFAHYLEFLPNSLNDILKNIDEDNFEAVEALAHQLKGSSANLRIEDISAFFAELNNAAKEKNKEDCISAIIKIKEKMELLNNLFSKFID